MNADIRNILVLGASGLIGRFVTDDLRGRGFSVVGVARRLSASQKSGPLDLELPVMSMKAERLARLLRDHSRGYRLLREALDESPPVHRLLYRVGLMSTPPEPVTVGRGSLGFYEIYRANHAKAWTEAWTLTEGLLLATRDLAEAHGARFAVIVGEREASLGTVTWKRLADGLQSEGSIQDAVAAEIRIGRGAVKS